MTINSGFFKKFFDRILLLLLKTLNFSMTKSRFQFCQSKQINGEKFTNTCFWGQSFFLKKTVRFCNRWQSISKNLFDNNPLENIESSRFKRKTFDAIEGLMFSWRCYWDVLIWTTCCLFSMHNPYRRNLSEFKLTYNLFFSHVSWVW